MSSYSNKKTFVYEGKDLESMSFAQNYHEWIYDLIKNSVGSRIAEIGSGTGNFTEILLNDYNEIHAFEPCSKTHNKSIHLGHQKVISINDNFENRKNDFQDFFDSVLFINVLEHIENDEFALKSANQILSPEGKLVIFVPALRWLYSSFDTSIGHFRRYHKKNLVNLVSKSGFKIDRCHYFDSMGILPWFFVMKMLGGSLNPTSVKWYDSIIVPWLKLVERFFIPPIGKNLLLVASKR